MNTIAERQPELIRFLKNYSIFQVLDEQTLQELGPLFTEMECGPGQIVFHEGDQADSMYVIKKGCVEVLQTKSGNRVVAYLTSGECFGEMAIIHDTTRNATIRVPEEASLLCLPKHSVKELTKRFPAVTTELAELINRRTTGDIPFKPPGLQGNLAFFDLPTVIQTVLNSRRTGILKLYGRSGKVTGQLIIRENVILQALFGELNGVSAFYELLNIAEPLDFTFEHKENSTNIPDPDLANRSPQMLLMEGARRADELPELVRTIGWPQAVCVPLLSVPNLDALGADRRQLCGQIWSLIEVGENVGQICHQLPCDRYSILSTVYDMLRLNLIRLDQQASERGKAETSSDLTNSRKHNKEDQRQTMISKTPDAPFELVKIINALNGVSTNLGLIYGKEEIRQLVQEALSKACKLYPNLSSIKIQANSPALDLRNATDDFSDSKATIPALLYLNNLLLELTIEMQKQEN